MPGAVTIALYSSREIELESSSGEPPRRIMATSSRPDRFSAARNPSPIDNSETSTATTPPMPITATSEVPMRDGRLRRFIAVTLTNWLYADRRLMDASIPPQRFDDAQAHGLPGRHGARDHTQ